MIRVHVWAIDDMWGWGCRQCQAGEMRNTWADAIADAFAHTKIHRDFGFRTGGR